MISASGSFMVSAAHRTSAFLAAAVLVAAFAFAHGGRVADNLHQLHWEDRAFFRYDAAHVRSVSDAFTHPGLWPGLYRPLTTNLYYHLGGRLFAHRIEAYHAVNVALVLGNGLLLFLLARRLVGAWALLAGALFVSRESHVEVVLNTCEFQVLASVTCSLVAALLFARARAAPPDDRAPLVAASAAAFGAALLCKESAVILPGVLFGYAWLFDDHRRAHVAVAPHAAVAAAWGVLFVTVFRAVNAQRPTGFAYRPTVDNVLTSYAAHLLDFFNPVVLPLDDLAMPPRVIALASSSAAHAALIALALLALALAALRARLPAWSREPAAALLFGFGWFVLATAPFAAFENRLYMRYSYFGHAGLALCAGALAQGVWRLARRLVDERPTTRATAPTRAAARPRRTRNFRPAR
jgi:hypothetical protein